MYYYLQNFFTASCSCGCRSLSLSLKFCQVSRDSLSQTTADATTLIFTFDFDGINNSHGNCISEGLIQFNLILSVNPFFISLRVFSFLFSQKIRQFIIIYFFFFYNPDNIHISAVIAFCFNYYSLLFYKSLTIVWFYFILGFLVILKQQFVINKPLVIS